MLRLSIALIALSTMNLGLALINLSFGSQESDKLIPRSATHETIMEVYFTPFDARTFLALTMQNVEEQSTFKFRFVFENPLTSPDHPFGKKLRRMLTATKTSEKISQTSIRLKVKYPEAVFFADRDGRVFSERTGERYQLTKKRMAEIESDIMYFSGVVDLDALKNMKDKLQ